MSIEATKVTKAEERIVPIPTLRPPFELWATIKKTSKYYRQGLAVPHQSDSGQIPFKIEGILGTTHEGYDFKGGPGGSYRAEDLVLWVSIGGKLKRLGGLQ